MKITENKPHSIHLRLTDEQFKYLVYLCEQNNNKQTISDIIRMFVDEKRYISSARFGTVFPTFTSPKEGI